MDPQAQRPIVDRSHLTILLPYSAIPLTDRNDCGRVRGGQAFNFQWIAESSGGDKPSPEMLYLVQVIDPQPDGAERLEASTSCGKPDEIVREKLVYRASLVAPAKTGKYVVRLLTPLRTISESVLDVF